MTKNLDEIFGEGTTKKLKENKLDENILEEIRKINNPENKPNGHYTGRCMRCHSDDLWTDATAYGCNTCDAIYFVGHLPPKIIMNNGMPETKEIQEHNKMIDEFYL